MRASLVVSSLALALAVALAAPSAAEAQRSRHADVWTFGTHCRMSWDAAARTPTGGTFAPIATAEGCASFADPSSGELLVASDGVTVWDGAGTMVATGLQGHTSSMHSGIIIPRPLTPNRLFVITHKEGTSSTVAYREIEFLPAAPPAMPRPSVTAIGSNVSVTLDGGAATGREGMLLIPHANGVDYWLLIAGDGYVFIAPVTVDGIGTVRRVATMVPIWTVGWNLFAASNAGDRLVVSDNSSVEGLPRGIYAFDFDRATGTLSGRRQLTADLDREYYGGAFSPDDTKLYFTTLTSRRGTATTPQVSRVYQYDFTAGVFTKLAELDTPYFNGQARLGPDGRVYVATGTAPDSSVSVIETPNAAGLAAGFRWGSFAMPAACSPALGLPQTVSPTARLLFGVDITAPVGSHGATTATPRGTANVADGQTITVTVTGEGGYVQTCTAVVHALAWECAPGAITGLTPGATYEIEAVLSPSVRDHDTFTVVDCFRDADCDTSAQFCNTESHACVPRITNGNHVPTIAGHDPTLDGECSAPVGDATCVSRVCEASDDLCGYRNGTDGGPCTATTGAIVCRSGVCSPTDGHCGYLDGEGPCSAADGAIVCRSGLCGDDGRCRPTTGCDTDADCITDTQYCDTPSHTCVPRVPNDMAVPTTPGHVPTLDGTCTEAAADAACLSRVCEESDDRCGFLPGSPCTSPIECRTFICAPEGRCGVCDERTACPSGEVCDLADGTCHASDAGVSGDVDGGVGEPVRGLAGGACGCSVRTDASEGAWLSVLGLLGLVVVRRRRRR